MIHIIELYLENKNLKTVSVLKFLMYVILQGQIC